MWHLSEAEAVAELGGQLSQEVQCSAQGPRTQTPRVERLSEGERGIIAPSERVSGGRPGWGLTPSAGPSDGWRVIMGK